MPDSVRWNYPTDVRFGAGLIGTLGAACQELAISRPLFVTDPGLAAMGMTKDAVQCCRDAGLGVDLFSDIKGNPTAANVAAGIAAYREGGHDGVVAFGGGSALDAAKAVAFLAGQTRPIWDFEDVGDNWKRADPAGIAPVVAIPTTAGTGSEVGRAASITDETQDLKRLVFHPRMLPRIVLLDPELTVGLPPVMTAATGMDALSHNLEAFCAPGDHPMARGIAVEGCRIAAEFLPTAVRDGDDIEARGRMLVASAMGAVAFQRGLGAMHALAHSLGGAFDAHHGTLNAVLMPYVLLANRAAIEDDIAYLTGCLGLDRGFPAFIDWVLELRAEVGMPHALAEIGIPNDAPHRIGRMAAIDPAAATNPIPFTATAYEVICRNAIEGRLD
jgi:alcohol dehydrogenase class IV